MAPPAPSFFRRWSRRQVALAAGLAVLIVVLAVVAVQTGLLDAIDAVILALREAGPLVFFGAMALLPAAGFPMIAFTLAAGPVFGPVLGTGWVIGWSMLAVVINLLLTYWLANRAVRPLVSRLLNHFDFHLPDDTTGGAWQITLIVRLTPGPPFWVQSYLLGTLRVPLMPYLVVSTLIMTGYIVALVSGGEAIVEGNGRLGLIAVGVLVLSVAVLQLLRQRTVRRRAATLSLGSPRILPAK